MTKSLTQRQQAAIEHILSSRNFVEASERSGIPGRTLRSWMQTDAFRSALREAQRQAMRVATQRLARACGAAVDALERVMGDSEAPDMAVVAAAKAVLEHAHKALELDDLAERLEKLEGAQAAETQGANSRATTTH